MTKTISLKIALPHSIFHEEEVLRIRAIASHGSLTLLPRHVDCVVDLSPGILSCESDEGTRIFAVDGGIMVKHEREVLVSTPHAVRPEGSDLGKSVREAFETIAERESRTRSALRKIEADFVRTFVEVKEDVIGR